ncbi:MAG: T9SS type A sorting domain-containing protein [Candidatus Kapaibacterium sp.]
MGKFLKVILLVFAFIDIAKAQISSAAFDPNCYQPVIGTPGVVDTIYGSKNGQELGSYIKNIGAKKGESNGSIIIGSGFGVPFVTYPIFQSGPNFNLHNLNAVDTFNLGYLVHPYNLVKRARFRSSQYTDMLFTMGSSRFAPRIYWADDQGKYDSTRYTELQSPITGTKGVGYNQINVYSTHLTSDTVEDIIFGIYVFNSSQTLDSVFFLFFKAGDKLHKQGKIAFADSIAFLDTIVQATRNCSQGDFRGTGREDLIASNGVGDIFFYKNDRPFSLQKLAQDMKYDTLMAQWQNPIGSTYFNENQLSMHAFNKSPGDSSVDFMPINHNIGRVYLYKGGPTFGSHRLFEDKADFVIRHPGEIDQQWSSINFGGPLFDCGNMTGTGNNVLLAGGDGDAGFYGHYFFYVLGDAMDEKVDMYFGVDDFPDYGGIDTITADHDGLQDVITGLPGYYSHEDHGKGKQSVGSVWIIHGSKKIPVHSNSVSSRKSVDESPSHILAYPNPCDEHTVLTFDNCSASRMQVQVISANGVLVKQEESPVVDGLQEYAVDLSTVAAGNYIVSLSCPANGWSSSVNVIKQGGAVKPWNLDLKKMVGR